MWDSHCIEKVGKFLANVVNFLCYFLSEIKFFQENPCFNDHFKDSVLSPRGPTGF
jgi:hypothetical protein